YRRQYLLEDGDFPGSMDAFSRVISLPLWPGMSSDQLERVIAEVKAIAQRHSR
ncbi:MAG: DegT/DnrJ/EryC1/StrS family aminotransferase, partial [Spirochaetaceae bacterium]|nr:DegT/DnrJ/EryC1/StrS family aminotransferase [Spirochaetaceae bacterium]